MARRTVLPDARTHPRFSGIATFLRYPRLEDVVPENRPVDWAIYGVPFDSGVTYRPGARFGPRAIRDASQYIKKYSLDHGVDLTAERSLADAGDAPVSPYSSVETLERVNAFALGLGEPGVTKLLAVGGDHSIAYANIKATFERQGRPAGGLALIHFDSHLDTVDAVWGSSWGHASPFRRAIEEGLVNPKKMVSVGIKSPLNSAEDLSFARQAGVAVLTDSQVRAVSPWGTKLFEFARGLGDNPTYISFDIDVFDPAFAPGTGTPAVGGFTSAEGLTLLRGLRGVRLVGADVVEVLPDRDPTGITALLASQVIYEVMCLEAARG